MIASYQTIRHNIVCKETNNSVEEQNDYNEIK